MAFTTLCIRIILDSPRSQELKDCWNVFSLITGHYEPNLKRLRELGELFQKATATRACTSP